MIIINYDCPAWKEQMHGLAFQHILSQHFLNLCNVSQMKKAILICELKDRPSNAPQEETPREDKERSITVMLCSNLSLRSLGPNTMTIWGHPRLYDLKTSLKLNSPLFLLCIAGTCDNLDNQPSDNPGFRPVGRVAVLHASMLLPKDCHPSIKITLTLKMVTVSISLIIQEK